MASPAKEALFSGTVRSRSRFRRDGRQALHCIQEKADERTNMCILNKQDRVSCVDYYIS